MEAAPLGFIKSWAQKLVPWGNKLGAPKEHWEWGQEKLLWKRADVVSLPLLFPLDGLESRCWVVDQMLNKGQTKALSFTSGMGLILPLESYFWAAAGSVPWHSEQETALEKKKKLVNNLYHFASCSQHFICLLKLKTYNFTWCSILSGQLSLRMSMSLDWLQCSFVHLRSSFHLNCCEVSIPAVDFPAQFPFKTMGSLQVN